MRRWLEVHRVPREFLIMLLFAAGVVEAQPAAGQSAPRGDVSASGMLALSGPATISGTVLSARGSGPLGRAIVTLVPIGDAVGDRAVWSEMSGTTGEDGSYRFRGVPRMRYRLLVRRIGYRPAALEIDLQNASAFHVSLLLQVLPVRLEPIEVHSVSADLYGRDQAVTEDYGRARVDLERWRQDVFLESDVRTLSYIDVQEAVTLGGTDPFRALQRLPGVTTRDDWTAESWTRGAPWDQTRVYFDGVPLFNPLHGAGVTSAVNENVLGAVTFHPGVRSASLGEGAAGVLNLQSRPAAGTGDIRGKGNLSLFDGGLTMERRLAEGRAGLVVGVRRSGSAMANNELRDGTTGNPGPTRFQLPDDFADIVGRFDYDLGDGRLLEVSGLWEQDWIDGSGSSLSRRDGTRGSLFNNDVVWGNTAGRATVTLPTRGVETRHTIGVNRFGVDVQQLNANPSPLDAFAFPTATQPETHGEILHVSLSGEVDLSPLVGGDGSWRAGYSVTHQAVQYQGAPSTPYPLQTFLSQVDYHERLTVGALWTERRWDAWERLSLQAGIRLEGSRAVSNAGAVRLAPSVSARYAVNPRLTASAGVGRSYQYTQALAAAGLRVGPALGVTHRWLVAGDIGPALRTDIATLGAEYWLGSEWLASANLYVRHSTGVVMPNPEPGRLTVDVVRDNGDVVLGERDHGVVGSNLARGVELSVRRLVGPATLSAGYAFGVSTMDALGLSFPSAADRTHAIDLTGTLRFPGKFLGGFLATGSAFTAASGAPFTRVHPGFYECDRVAVVCEEIVPTLVEEPNGERSPWYASLDMMLDWTRKFSAWQLGIYLQWRNATDRDNAVTYTVGWGDQCQRATPDAPFCGAEDDLFESGFPSLTIIGVRVGF